MIILLCCLLYTSLCTCVAMHTRHYAGARLSLIHIFQDDMLLAQLAFFQSLASDIEPFLTEYQSNDPLAPFLHSSLYHLLKCLMPRFVKDEVMDAVNSPEKLVRTDILKSNNIKMAKNIKIGYQAESAIRKIKSTKSISNITILKF